jgi:hypothetical protein
LPDTEALLREFGGPLENILLSLIAEEARG